MKGLRAKAGSWVLFGLRVTAYLALATLANVRSWWNWMSEPRGFLCDRPSRGAAPNATKIKVLVYGPGKTGTTATADILSKIYDNSWHSGDFLLHVWAPLADRYWSKEENGGSSWPWHRLATPAAPAYKGSSLWPRRRYGSDRILQNGLDPAELAEALEKCNADSMTFDGLDQLFWTLYDISPEAKVLFLNWRGYKAWTRSRRNFRWDRDNTHLLLNFLVVGQHYLPWNALVLPLLDYFHGGATELMRSGKRMKDLDRSLSAILLRQSVTERRLLQHHRSGLGGDIRNESQYNQYWLTGKKIIPEERRAELNLIKHSPADLCRMLGVTDKPICKDTGNIPQIRPGMKMGSGVSRFLCLTTPWFLFLHWANHTLTWTVIYWIAGKLSPIVIGSAASLRCKRLLEGNKECAKKA